MQDHKGEKQRKKSQVFTPRQTHNWPISCQNLLQMLPVLGMPLFYLESYYPYQRNKNIAVIFSAQPLQQRASVLAYQRECKIMFGSQSS